MMKGYRVVAIALLVTGCGGTGGTEATIANETVATTTMTTSLARATTQAPIAQATETEPPLPTNFVDEFDGALGDGWIWELEAPGQWSLTAAPGWLQITATDLAQNVLVRDPPEGSYEVTTALRFLPTSNFQFAGLVVASKGSEATFLQLGRAYCDPVAVPDSCIGDGVYLDNVEKGEMVGSSIAELATNAEVLYLRLVVDGDTYAGYFSEDGETWTLVGEHTRSFGDAKIGLIAHQALEEPAIAEFDHVTVTSATTAPPTVTALPSYEDVVADYPEDVRICDTEALLTAIGSDGSWQLEIQGGALVFENEIEFPCFGMRVGLLEPLGELPAGSVVVAGPDTDPAALDDKASLNQAALTVAGEEFAVLMGPHKATWIPPDEVMFVPIAEEVGVGSEDTYEVIPLPFEYLLVEEQEVLRLAEASGFVAHVLIREGELVFEPEAYESGWMLLIIEGGVLVDGWIVP